MSDFKTVIDDTNYHLKFNFKTGMTVRYGSTYDDDPDFCPYGPEIADIEISTICHGINNVPCRFCYKSNVAMGSNMNLNTFKSVFKQIKTKALTQIAFGIGSIDANPDLFKIMEYTRENGVIPNITINGDRMIKPFYDKLAALCGAVAVSHYTDELCYRSVYELSNRIGKGNNTIRQVNIHQLFSEETFDECLRTIRSAKSNKLLSKLNAIVFLMLKPKGRGVCLNKISSEQKYIDFIKVLDESDISYGFDSCGSYQFLKVINDDKNKFKNIQKEFANKMVESCESTLFSIYVNSDGICFPCSFCEDVEEGFDIVNTDKDFINDYWNNPDSPIGKFRMKLLNTTSTNEFNCRECPVYNLRLSK